MILPIRSLVSGPDNLCLLSPDHALAIGTSDNVFLIIDGAEYHISRDTNRQDSSRSCVREINRVAGKVLRLESVDCRKPDHGTPSKVESVVVVANIDGAEIPTTARGYVSGKVNR